MADNFTHASVSVSLHPRYIVLPESDYDFLEDGETAADWSESNWQKFLDSNRPLPSDFYDSPHAEEQLIKLMAADDILFHIDLKYSRLSTGEDENGAAMWQMYGPKWLNGKYWSTPFAK